MVVNRRIDLAGSLVLCAVGLAIAVYAGTAPPPTLVYDAIGPMGFPLVLGSALAGLGLLQSVRTVRALRTSGPVGVAEGTEDEPEHPSSGLRGLGFIGGSILYVVLVEPIGFPLLTPFALIVALTAMGYGSWRSRVVTSLLFTVVGFVLFVNVLAVPLPPGILADPLIALGIIDFR